MYYFIIGFVERLNTFLADASAARPVLSKTQCCCCNFLLQFYFHLQLC